MSSYRFKWALWIIGWASLTAQAADGFNMGVKIDLFSSRISPMIQDVNLTTAMQTVMDIRQHGMASVLMPKPTVPSTIPIRLGEQNGTTEASP